VFVDFVMKISKMSLLALMPICQYVKNPEPLNVFPRYLVLEDLTKLF
jgi:hypothetical protein